MNVRATALVSSALCSFAFVCLAQIAPGAAPIPRHSHTAIWTGSEMIVWGGSAINGAPLGDGARYDPRNNTWTPISMANAPSPRFDHTAVWTGSEMFIWGGRSGSFNFLAEGYRYNLALDLWTPMNHVGAPTSITINHSAVWTGTEMILWGGLRPDLTQGNDGARYNSTNDSWTYIPTNGAPGGRSFHSAVWTGNRMVIWGGNRAVFNLHTMTARATILSPVAGVSSPPTTLPADATGMSRPGPAMSFLSGADTMGLPILATAAVTIPPRMSGTSFPPSVLPVRGVLRAACGRELKSLSGVVPPRITPTPAQGTTSQPTPGLRRQ